MPERYLILGEAPGRHSTSTWSRQRLRDLADRDLEEWADWVNLVEEWPGPQPRGKGSAWNARAALARAEELRETFPEYAGVVCLGRRVGGAIISGGGGFPYFRWTDSRGARVVVIPHPSGIVRWWNEPENVERAREFLSALAKGAANDHTQEGIPGAVEGAPGDADPPLPRLPAV